MATRPAGFVGGGPPAEAAGRHGPPEDGALGAQVRRGLAWSTVSAAVLKVGGVAVGVLAARLLAPDEFGVFAVALVVHAVILNVSDVGVSAYLVRHDGDVGRILPTVMTVALATATGLAGVMALTAPHIAELLGSADATSSVRVLSLAVLLAGVSAVPNAMLVRAFRQRARFVAESLGFVASTLVLIVMALDGHGALALAWSRVAGHVVTTLLFVVLAPRLPRLGLDPRQVPLLLSFGLPLVGNTLLGFALLNVDYVVIGRVLGAEQLGNYYLAFNIASWPFLLVSPVLANVALAAFGRLRSDPVRLAEAVTHSLSLLLALALPVSLLLAALAEPVIGAVYGSTWTAAAGALAFTAVYGALRIPVDLFSNVAITLGRTRALLVAQVGYGLLLAPLTVLLVRGQGIAGAGLAHVLAIALVLLPALVLMAIRHAGVPASALRRAATPPVAAAVVAAVAAHLVAEVLSSRTDSPWAALLGGGTAGGLLYLSLLRRWLIDLLHTRRPAPEDREHAVPAPAEPPLTGVATA